MSETPLNQDQNSDEIDLRDLILPLWKARKQILTIATLCGILGGIIGFLTPATYTASSTFLPQTSQSGGGLSGSLGGLASLAGINLNAPMSGGDIPPSLYATVLASEPFRKRILDAKIWVNGDTVTYRNYLIDEPEPILNKISAYTIGLPWKIIDLFTGKDEKSLLNKYPVGLQQLSNSDYNLISIIFQRIKIKNDTDNGVVVISVVENDPIVAAQVTKATQIILQDWIIEFKIKNARAQYDFIERQFEAKQKEFFSIQDQLADYMDRNQNVLSATYLTKLERLQAEFDLVNTVYSELAKQKEQAAIQLSKDTPTFSELDPVKIPRGSTGPKINLYIIGFGLFGGVFASIWVLALKHFIKFFKSIENSSK